MVQEEMTLSPRWAMVPMVAKTDHGLDIEVEIKLENSLKGAFYKHSEI